MADDSFRQVNPVHLNRRSHTYMESSRKEVKPNCRLTKRDDSSEYAYLVGSKIRGPTRPCTVAVAAVTDLQNGRVKVRERKKAL